MAPEMIRVRAKEHMRGQLYRKFRGGFWPKNNDAVQSSSGWRDSKKKSGHIWRWPLQEADVDDRRALEVVKEQMHRSLCGGGRDHIEEVVAEPFGSRDHKFYFSGKKQLRRTVRIGTQIDSSERMF